MSALQNLGSFVPQRADFAQGREGDKGELEEPTQQRWFDVSAYRVPGRLPGARRAQHAARACLQPHRSRAREALPVRVDDPSRVPAEVFNLFNTTNFGTPASNISNVNAGIISTADDARNAQLSARFIW